MMMLEEGVYYTHDEDVAKQDPFLLVMTYDRRRVGVTDWEPVKVWIYAASVRRAYDCLAVLVCHWNNQMPSMWQYRTPLSAV